MVLVLHVAFKAVAFAVYEFGGLAASDSMSMAEGSAGGPRASGSVAPICRQCWAELFIGRRIAMPMAPMMPMRPVLPMALVVTTLAAVMRAMVVAG